jgi:hypothetical protein
MTPMNTVQSALSSPRVSRILFWVGAAVLAAGVVVMIIKLVPGSSGGDAAPSAGFKPVLPAGNPPRLQTASGKPVTTFRQLDPSAKLAVREFILTAVARKHLAQSWQYLAPSMKKGYTLKTWVKGDIPVVPYPVWKYDKLSQHQLIQANQREITVDLSLSANPKANQRPLVFRIGLEKAGTGDNSRWLVNYWMPRSGAMIVPAGDEKG